MIDPKAPADDPRHPSKQTDTTLADRAEEQRMAEEEVRLLSDTHITDAERDALSVGDLEQPPGLDELRVRRDALVDYLERRHAEPQPALPEIVDLTGAEHVLTVSEDGSQASWSLVPQEADSDQQGASEADSGDTTPAEVDTKTEAEAPAELDDALAQLDKAKTRKRGK
jgi:hypothetical protein